MRLFFTFTTFYMQPKTALQIRLLAAWLLNEWLTIWQRIDINRQHTSAQIQVWMNNSNLYFNFKRHHRSHHSLCTIFVMCADGSTFYGDIVRHMHVACSIIEIDRFRNKTHKCADLTCFFFVVVATGCCCSFDMLYLPFIAHWAM